MEPSVHLPCLNTAPESSWIPTTRRHKLQKGVDRRDDANWCVKNAAVKRAVKARAQCTSAFWPVVCIQHGIKKGGFGMTPWYVLVCSWRRQLADRHLLPFPWTLCLHRRRCPSVSHPPVTFLSLLGLSLPLYTPLPWVGCANRAPALSLVHCSVLGPHRGGQLPSPLARCVQERGGGSYLGAPLGEAVVAAGNKEEGKTVVMHKYV